jgi:hypothetical protein
MNDNWYPNEDLNALRVRASLALQKNDGDLLELGVWEGRSARVLCDLAEQYPNRQWIENKKPRERCVFCVDPWAPSADVWGDAPEAYVSWIESAPPNAITFRLKGEEFLEHDKGPHYALVHIDADHTYEGTLEQVRLAWGKLQVGGLLIGHDANHEPVRRAVRDGLGVDPKVDRNVWYVWKRSNHGSLPNCPKGSEVSQ